MSDRKSLAQRIDQGSFRPDRHAELLAMSPPLPEYAPEVYRVVRGNPLGHGLVASVPEAQERGALGSAQPVACLCLNSSPAITSYCGRMEEADREVLEFIGDQGKTAEQVSDRFPAFELERLVRDELARPRRTNPVQSQSRHTRSADEHTFYVLTSRGAEAIGLASHTLHSD